MDAEWTGVQPARHPGAGLVEVGDLGPRQLLADPIDEPAQPPGGLGRQPSQRPRRHAGAQRIAEHLGGALDRQVLPHRQISPNPANPGAVARRRACLPRKHPGGEVPAGARSPLGPMLPHPQPHLGQIEDLPGLHPDHRRQGQIPTTAIAGHRPVHHDRIRVSHLGQVRARRAELLARAPATTTTTPLPPGRGRLAKPVRRRRPGGVGGVLAQAPLQLGDPGRQCRIGRHQSGVGRPQLVDHHRLDRDGGLQIQIGGRDRGLLDNERSRPLAHGPMGQLPHTTPASQPTHSAAQPAMRV